MGEYFFKVAGFVFGVTVPDDTDIEKPASFLQTVPVL